VSIVIRLRAEQAGSIPSRGGDIFLFATEFRRILGPSQSPVIGTEGSFLGGKAAEA
jgi:hypothetical protein